MPSRLGNGNRLLAGLSDFESEHLLRHMTEVSLVQGQTLWNKGNPIDAAYFPETCMISISALINDHDRVDVAAIGNEGVVGLPMLFSPDRSSCSAVVQVPGRAARIDAWALREEAAHEGPLQQLLQRYAQAFMTQISQTSACAHSHRAQQRLARWLLTAQDCAGRSEFPLTHDFLAQALGVRRATVTEVAGAFQAAGLIRYRRGAIVILDRAGLRHASCSCYRVVQDEFDRLFGVVTNAA